MPDPPGLEDLEEIALALQVERPFGVAQSEVSRQRRAVLIFRALQNFIGGNGDVLLQVFRNDLGQHSVTSPLWQLIPGMEGAFHPTFDGYVDDKLGVNTGSVPLWNDTRVGFAARFETASRAAYFDHITVDRQL